MSKRRERRTAMEAKEAPRFLCSTVASFLRDRLAHRSRRLRHKDQCSERLAAAGAAAGSVPYSDQALLANLDWGIDALEDAIATSNPEARLARLAHAQRLLQVCAMLDPALATAGVPNSYLSAWAHLHLSYLWALRAADGSSSPDALRRRSVVHALEMFAVEPFFSRVDFAPELWEALFLPRIGSILGRYSESRRRVLAKAVPDAGGDRLFDESLVVSLAPDEAEKVRELEAAYGRSLDDSTRRYAKYYLECLSYGPTSSGGKKGVAPSAEPPSREVGRSIPDYVKFGPILPRSAGFPSVGKENQRDDGSAGAASNPSFTINSYSEWEGSYSALHFEEAVFVGNEEKINSRGCDVSADPDSRDNFLIDSDIGTCNIATNTTKSNEDDRNSTTYLSRKKYDSGFISPLDPVEASLKAPCSKIVESSKRAPEKFIRLSSSRIRGPTLKVSSPLDSTETSSPKVLSPKLTKKSEALSHHLSGHSGMLSESSIVTSVDSDDVKSIRNSFSGMVVRTSTASISKPNFHKKNEKQGIQIIQRRPPKDFVCSITGLLFDDPVTLETGQTYERMAIHEWLKRGNITCPITRQPLSSTILPKTNYVLKRLITSWKDRHPDLAQEASDSGPPSASLRPMCYGGLSNSADSPAIHRPLPLTADNTFEYQIRSKRFMQAAVSVSPTSMICQAAMETAINGLKQYVSCLCTSEDLQELEAAVLTIARILKDSKANQGICMYLSEPTTVSGLMEILPISVTGAALRASIYILSKLVFVNGSVGEILMSVESDFDCLVTLLKNGLVETAVLIYLLEPAFSRLSNCDLIPSLLQVISRQCDQMDEFQFPIEPKDASVAILEHILLGGDKTSQTLNAMSVVSSNGIPSLIECLTRVEGGPHVISILLICMRADRSCRNLIAKDADLVPVLELFQAGSDTERQICIDFFYEIICLSRGAFRKEILQVIKDGGACGTMHSFLAYLQTAPMEQKPIVASLLLQLDLLVEPQKMSIYREDSIDAFIEALYWKDFPICQTIALNALSSLSGRFDASGNSLTEAWLLKVAGVELPNTSLTKEGGTQTVEAISPEVMEEEEKANSIWEKRISFVLCNHDNGSIFKALEECSRSHSVELLKSWLVLSTWLIHMLHSLPDVDTRVVARRSLLQQFINVLQAARNFEDRVLAGLALKSFINDQDALRELGVYMESIFKPLRKLKKCSTVAADTLRALLNLPSIDTRLLCCCTEVDRIDSSINGELLSLAYLRGRLFSGHSDGSIKGWDAGKRGLRLIQHVREHTRAVTCLSIPSSGNKLYSGSLDKTIRVCVC